MLEQLKKEVYEANILKTNEIDNFFHFLFRSLVRIC